MFLLPILCSNDFQSIKFFAFVFKSGKEEDDVMMPFSLSLPLFSFSKLKSSDESL